MKQQIQYTFENQKLYNLLCGIADQNILELEQLLQVELIPRGNSFIVQSQDAEKIQNTISFFDTLHHYYQKQEIESFDFKFVKNLFQKHRENEFFLYDEELESEKIFTTHKGKPIYTKTITQKKYIQSLFRNPVTIAIGPAGTGKTFLSVVVASKLLLRGEIERIIITRPAVEAGENLGFLPGDMVQKVDPYLRPIYDSLYEILGTEKTTHFLQTNKIEVAPLAYMRGRTLNDSMIILDEAQNCTLSQLKMFVTRLGKNSRMCISGDLTQSDLKPGQSGLGKLIEILSPIKEVQVIEFHKQDIIRNTLIEKIIHAFEEFEEKEKQKNPSQERSKKNLSVSMKKARSDKKNSIYVRIDTHCPYKDLRDFLVFTAKKSLKFIEETEAIKGPFEVSIKIVDNTEIQKLNQVYRNKDNPTDVLSFSQLEGEWTPMDGFTLLGDIVISWEKALEQSRQLHHSFYYEILRLFAHGLYHLLGYDHEDPREETLMQEKEKKLIENLLQYDFLGNFLKL